nr:MFS transporter [Chloroflexaceae bacterium]
AYGAALASVALLALLALLPALRAFPVVASSATAAVVEEGKPLPVRRLLRYALAGLLLGIAGGAILPFQNLFFRNVFQLSDATVGLVLAWASLGMGLGALIGSPVSKRLGLRRAAAVLRLGAVPAMLLMFAPALFPAVVGFFLRGLFVAASFPLNDAMVMQATPVRQRGLAASMMSVLWSGGWSLTALWSGWAQQRVGFAAPIALAAVAYLLSALAIYTLRIDERRNA